MSAFSAKQPPALAGSSALPHAPTEPSLSGEPAPSLAGPEHILLRAHEAANQLGISRAHFLNLDSSGRVPRKLTLGKSARWSLQELRDWASAGCPPRERWELLRAGDQ